MSTLEPTYKIPCFSCNSFHAQKVFQSVLWFDLNLNLLVVREPVVCQLQKKGPQICFEQHKQQRSKFTSRWSKNEVMWQRSQKFRTFIPRCEKNKVSHWSIKGIYNESSKHTHTQTNVGYMSNKLTQKTDSKTIPQLTSKPRSDYQPKSGFGRIWMESDLNNWLSTQYIATVHIRFWKLLVIFMITKSDGHSINCLRIVK